jgi:hypothetical protein
MMSWQKPIAQPAIYKDNQHTFKVHALGSEEFDFSRHQLWDWKTWTGLFFPLWYNIRFSNVAAYCSCYDCFYGLL